MTERNISIDIIKIVAMYMIMCLHTTMSHTDTLFGFIPYTIAGLGMPLFFMVSGYLMWNRDIDYRYVFKKILAILKFVAIISFAFWLCFGINKDISYLQMFLGSFVQKYDLGQFWYFLSIMIIYATLPILNQMKKRCKSFSILFVLFWALIAYFMHALNITDGFEKLIPQPFRLWNWFLLFGMGGVISEMQFYKIRKELLIPFALIALCVFVLYAIIMHSSLKGRSAEFQFGNPILWITACSIFISILKCKMKDYKIVSRLSLLFLPSYVFHFLVIRIVKHFTKMIDIGDFIVYVNCILVMIMTTICCYMLMQIPYMNKIFKI